MGKNLVYLSGAPRVSTRSTAEMAGPRAHVLGIINGFKQLGWAVEPFIVGDQVPESWIASGSEQAVSKSPWRTFLSDLVRIYLNFRNCRLAYQRYGQNADLVYERFGAFQSLGRSFKHKGIPWILETNAPLFYESKNQRKTLFLSGLARYLEKKAYEDCCLLVCISESLKEIIVAEFGIDAGKILVLPNGVDSERLSPNRFRGKRLFEEFTVGFVGSLYPWSGLEDLIRAIGNLHRKGLNLNLTIVGDGQVKDALETLVKDLDLVRQVAFVGRVPSEEVPEYIAGFDICFSGQTQFGPGKMYLSPLKLYEYMAMGRPVIISAFEDAVRVVANGETGFLFEPGNQADLLKSLEKAYTHRDRLTAMGQKSRRVIEANHSWTARVNQINVLFENGALKSKAS